MPIKDVETPYPVIDKDPHFFRVVRYFRPTDYAAWAVGTAAAPAILLGFEKMNPSGPAKAMKGPLKIAGLIGAFGGFLYAYQKSSLRFWGWEENVSEVEKDKAEMQQRIAEGKPLYGDSQLSPYLQSVSSANSKNAQLKFSAIPWFNFANHDNHGVDASKYNETQ